HRFLQNTNSGVAAAPDTTFGHLGEQAFHEVQPTSAGGCEVNVIARMACQPVPDLFDLVCAVVIHDEMHVQAGRKVVLNLVQKTQELLVTMPPEAGEQQQVGGQATFRSGTGG